MEDELQFELAIRNIPANDPNRSRRLQQKLFDEAVGDAAGPLDFMRMTRNTLQQELRECDAKLREVEVAINEASRTVDDDLSTRGLSRLIHIDGRIQRLREYAPESSAVQFLVTRSRDLTRQAKTSRDSFGSGTRPHEVLEGDNLFDIEDDSAGAMGPANGTPNLQGQQQQLLGTPVRVSPILQQSMLQEQQSQTNPHAPSANAVDMDAQLALRLQREQQLQADEARYQQQLQQQQQQLQRQQEFALRLQRQEEQLRGQQERQEQQRRHQLQVQQQLEEQTRQIAARQLQSHQQVLGAQPKAGSEPPQIPGVNAQQTTRSFDMWRNPDANDERQPPVPGRRQPPIAPPRGVNNEVEGDMASGQRSGHTQRRNYEWEGGHRINQWSLRFDGGPKCLDAEDFIFRVETQAKLCGVSQAALVIGFGQLLRGLAEQWFWTYQHQHETSTWAQMKSAFVKRYTPKRRTDQEIKARIANRKQQDDESFNTFCQDVEALASRLTHRMEEDEMLEVLRRNMTLELRKETRRDTFWTVDELLQSCAEFELLCKEEHQLKLQRRQPRVHELAYEEPLNQYMADLQCNVEPVEYVEAVRAGGNNGDLAICWNCKDIGHVHAQCKVPRKSVFCFSCGMAGVVSTECPKCSVNYRRGGLTPNTVRPSNQQQSSATYRQPPPAKQATAPQVLQRQKTESHNNPFRPGFQHQQQ